MCIRDRDKPLPVQLARFYRDALRGDLGVSHIYRTNVPVTTILAEKIPVSLKLGIAAMLLAMAVGIPMGILMARSNRCLLYTSPPCRSGP